MAHKLSIVTTNADGIDVMPHKEPIPVTIAENTAGANVTLLLLSPFPGPGRYTFSVSLDDVLLTRVPLTIVTAALSESFPPTGQTTPS